MPRPQQQPRRGPKPTPPVDPRQALLRAVPGTAAEPPPALRDLEALLTEQAGAYRALAVTFEASRLAMAELRLGELNKLTADQAERREQLVRLERRRAALTKRLGVEGGAGTILDLAERYPARGKALRALRDRLKAATAEARHAGKLAGGVAGGVLGHLNTAVRLLDECSGEHPGYATDGTRRAAARRRALVEAVA